MKGLLRQRYGLAEQDYDIVKANLDKHRAVTKAMTQQEKDYLVDYIEGVHQGPLKPEIQQLADALRKITLVEKDKLQRTYGTSGMSFIKDYFPHLYKQDAALEAYLGHPIEPRTPGTGKQGSSALTRARTQFPTFSEARAFGLSPLYDDPIDMILASYRQKSMLVASHEVKDAMQQGGVLRYGIPNSTDWRPIKGRFATNAGGQQGYAPKEIAKYYNNWISQPWRPESDTGAAILDTLNEVSNLTKGMKFSISAHHAVTTMTENAARSMGAAFEQLSAGNPAGAAKALTDIAGAGVWKRGQLGLDIRSGLVHGTPEEERLVSYLVQANPSARGAGQDFRYASQSIMNKYAQSVSPQGTQVASGLVNGFQKALDQTTKPVFEHFVPQIKWGNMMRDMGNWLRANPRATQEEILAAARKISDHADDVFGEMQRSNLFWNKSFLQGADMALLSPTYTFGSWRGLGGGLLNLGKKGAMTAIGMGKKAPAFSPASPNYAPNMGYAAGLAASTAMISAVLQKAFTGTWPSKPWNFLSPQTGGITISSPGKKGEAQHPESLGAFGNIKEAPDVGKSSGALGGRPDVMEYLRPKLSPLADVGWSAATGKDWKGDEIMRPTGKGAATDFATYAAKDVAPISLSQLFDRPNPISSALGWKTNPRYAKTAIPWWMSVLGYRPAGMQVYDPQGFRAMMDKKARREDKKK